MSQTNNEEKPIESTALFACPFCGGRVLQTIESQPGMFRVVCMTCSAAGPQVAGKHELDFEVSMLTQTRAATGPMGAWQMRGGRCHTDPKHPLANAGHLASPPETPEPKE